MTCSGITFPQNQNSLVGVFGIVLFRPHCDNLKCRAHRKHTKGKRNMDTFEAIRTRRSIRRFTEKPVENKKVQKILEAVRLAPSWGNIQCWRLIVVKDSRTKKAISELTGLFDRSLHYIPGANPAKKGITEAPVLLILCADPSQFGPMQDRNWHLIDIGIAAQNLMLAAKALDLGSVFVGVFDEEKIRDILNIPQNIHIVGLFPVGYPRKSSEKRTPRKPLREFVFYGKWR